MDKPVLNEALREFAQLCNLQLLRHARADYPTQLILIATSDGIPLAWTGNVSGGVRRAAAMAAALSGLSGTIVRETSGGTPEGVLIDNASGVVVSRSLAVQTRELVLFLVFDPSVSQGQALWHARALGDALVGAITEPQSS